MNKRRSKSAEASTLRPSTLSHPSATQLPSLRRRSSRRRNPTRPSSEPSTCKLPPIVDGNAKLKQDLNDYRKNLEKRNLIRLTTSREIERADSSSDSSSASPLTSPRDVVVFKEEKSVVEEEEEEQSPLFMTQDISAISSPPCSKEENESVRKQIEEIDRRLSELSSATPSKETDGNEASQRT